MATTADQQRTLIIGITTGFVLLVVAVSLWGFGSGSTAGPTTTAQPENIPFGPLGNGLASCQQRQPPGDGYANFVVVYSTQDEAAKSYAFKVELAAPDGTVVETIATTQASTEATDIELVLQAPGGRTDFSGCRIIGIQQDKRVLIEN